jgi:hypothetical protein
VCEALIVLLLVQLCMSHRPRQVGSGTQKLTNFAPGQGIKHAGKSGKDGFPGFAGEVFPCIGSFYSFEGETSVRASGGTDQLLGPDTGRLFSDLAAAVAAKSESPKAIQDSFAKNRL